MLLDLALTVLLYLLVPPRPLLVPVTVSPPVSDSHSGKSGCLTSALRQAAGNCGDSSRRGFVCWARLPKLFLETALRSAERDLREFNFSLALVCHTLSLEAEAEAAHTRHAHCAHDWHATKPCRVYARPPIADPAAWPPRLAPNRHDS